MLADASQLEGEEEAETRSLDVELQERDSFPVLNAHTMASRLASWDFPDCARGFRPPTHYLPQGQGGLASLPVMCKIACRRLFQGL